MKFFLHILEEKVNKNQKSVLTRCNFDDSIREKKGGKCMKRKKIVSVVLATLAAFGFILSGCSNNAGGGNGGNEETDISESAQINFYVWDELEKFENLAESFGQVYPNWTVDVELIAGDYFNNLKSYFGAGNAPDLFYIEQGEIQQFLVDDLVLNLSPYLEESELLAEEDLWAANDGYRYDAETGTLGEGDLYAFCKDITSDFVMVYNKSHIDEYDATHSTPLKDVVGYPVEEGTNYPSESEPMTWAQNELFCHELAQFDGSGNLVRYGTLFDYSPWVHVMEWVQQTGSSLFSEDGKTFNGEDPNVIAAFQHLTNYQFGEMKSAVPLDVNSISSGQGFKNGDVSVVWYGRWAWQAYGWYDATFDIGVAPPPMPQADMEPYSATSPVGIAIKSDTQYPYVAYKFLEFILTTGSMQTVRSGDTYNLPGNRTIASGDAFLQTDDEQQRELNNYFFNITSNAKTLRYSPYIDTSSMTRIFGLEYGKTWDSNASSRLSASEALLRCKSSIDQQIKNFLERL